MILFKVGIFIYSFVFLKLMKPAKFNSSSEIELFKALQRYGRLSHEKLAQKTGVPKSTIQYANKRIQKRGFFDIKAMPKLEDFPELPLALVSFNNLHPIRLKTLKKVYLKKEEVRVLFTDNEKVFMILMHKSKEKLAELIFEIMEKAQAKPDLHMLSPVVEKMDLTIPDNILEALYAN